METLGRDILLEILSFVEDLRYRRVCKLWSLTSESNKFFHKSIIEATIDKLKIIPLSPFIISVIQSIQDGTRNRIIIAINKPLEISTDYYYEGMEDFIVSCDSHNYIRVLQSSTRMARILSHSYSITEGSSYVNNDLLLVLHFMSNKAINCLVSFSLLIGKECFKEYFEIAVRTLRSPENIYGFKDNLSPIIADLMRNFPFFQPTINEIYDLLGERRKEKIDNDLLYIMEHGWFEILEEEVGRDDPDKDFLCNYEEIRNMYLERKNS